jgi:hypothetical protein
MFEDLLYTYFTLFNVLRWNKKNMYIYAQYHRFKFILIVFVYCFSCSSLQYNNIASIKSETFHNLTNLYQM